MKRERLRRFGIAGAALFTVLGAALAALSVSTRSEAVDTPPGPPMTAYGEANGGVAGQQVFAVITTGGVSKTCGQGLVVDDGGPKFVVDVVAESQVAGCGAAGRSVSFYFAPTAPGQGGRKGNATVSWEQATAKQANQTLGQPLQVRAALPLVSRAN